ncbi:MAG TPA: ThiF family adenylyltransferase [bacterium]|nr:ThiF family adenylyltransferase [bacterium]
MVKGDKYYSFLARSIPFLTEEGVKKLRNSTIAIAGCGGVGGASAVTLARLGVGRFRLADPGRFDEPDVNRQWAAFKSTLGKNKAEVYEKVLKDINPTINIKKFCKGVPFDSLSSFLDNVDIVIDSLDYFVNYESRKELYREARKKGIFMLTSSIVGFGATLMGFSPFGMKHEDFTKSWNKNMPFHIKKYSVPWCIDLIKDKMKTHEIPSLSLSCNLAGSLLAAESLIILLQDILPIKREPIIAPKFVIVDLFRQKYNILDATKL